MKKPLPPVTILLGMTVLLGLTPFIAGCTTTPIVTKPEYVKIEIPKSLFTCITKGKKPDPTKMTDEQLTLFIESIQQRLEICGINLKSVEKRINKFNANVDALNAKNKQKK